MKMTIGSTKWILQNHRRSRSKITVPCWKQEGEVRIALEGSFKHALTSRPLQMFLFLVAADFTIQSGIHRMYTFEGAFSRPWHLPLSATPAYQPRIQPLSIPSLMLSHANPKLLLSLLML